jgi:hypothetical protein
MSKQDMRKELASLSFTEKVGILERLRERSLAFCLVKLSLVAGLGDPMPDQAREKLEADAQKYLNSYLKSETPSSSRPVLHELLRHWVEHRRGKVGLEIEVDGKSRRKEITRTEELDNLLGRGRTPADLLRALGGKSNGS